MRNIKNQLQPIMSMAGSNNITSRLLALQDELAALDAEYQDFKASLLLAKSRELEVTDDGFKTGNTGFILCCSAVVMLMTLPGISLFYAGAVKIRHIMTTFIQTMAITGVVTIVWQVCGYSLAFGPSSQSSYPTPLFGDGSRLWLEGMQLDSVHQMAPTIPESAFCMFQLSNAIIACALIVGGFACRTRFLSVLLFISLWLICVYCPLSHSHRHPDGFLYNMNVLDFAGGNVVHISAGITALMASYYVGPHSNTNELERFESRNILMSVWGACFVLIGWFGFNMGSSYSSGASSSRTLIVTILGASSSTTSWIAVEWFKTGTPSILGILCASVAGLVSISAGVGYIDETGAVVTGGLTGIACFLGVERVKKINSLDDPLNTFSLNFIGGLVGGLMVGFFARFPHGDTEDDSINGLFYGNSKQIYIQLFGILITTAWSAAVSGTILYIVDKAVGFRVPSTHEAIGLDIAQLHESIIDTPQKKMSELIKKTVEANVRVVDPLNDMGDDLDVLNRGDNDHSADDIGGSSNHRIVTQKSIISGND